MSGNLPSGVLAKATPDTPRIVLFVPPNIVKKGPEASVAEGTGTLYEGADGSKSTQIFSQTVPCHSDMVCCVSMELAQDLSPAGSLTGSSVQMLARGETGLDSWRS